MATLGLLKVEVFWNKDYDAIIYVYDVINQVLPCDSNYIVDAVMWPKIGNCCKYMKHVIITSVLQGFDQ